MYRLNTSSNIKTTARSIERHNTPAVFLIVIPVGLKVSDNPRASVDFANAVEWFTYG